MNRPGQLYVALSRVRTMDDINLLEPLSLASFPPRTDAAAMENERLFRLAHPDSSLAIVP